MIEEKHLAKQAIWQLRLFTSMAVLIVPGYLSFDFLPDGHTFEWVRMLLALIGIVGFLAVFCNSLTCIINRKDGQLDEWESGLKKRSQRFAFNIIVLLTVTFWLTAVTLSLVDATKNSPVTLSWAQIQSALFCFVILFTILPAIYVAWSVNPLETD